MVVALVRNVHVLLGKYEKDALLSMHHVFAELSETHRSSGLCVTLSPKKPITSHSVCLGGSRVSSFPHSHPNGVMTVSTTECAGKDKVGHSEFMTFQFLPASFLHAHIGSPLSSLMAVWEKLHEGAQNSISNDIRVVDEKAGLNFCALSIE